jgi:hypothetical protein
MGRQIHSAAHLILPDIRAHCLSRCVCSHSNHCCRVRNPSKCRRQWRRCRCQGACGSSEPSSGCRCCGGQISCSGFDVASTRLVELRKRSRQIERRPAAACGTIIVELGRHLTRRSRIRVCHDVCLQIRVCLCRRLSQNRFPVGRRTRINPFSPGVRIWSSICVWVYLPLLFSASASRAPFHPDAVID